MLANSGGEAGIRTPEGALRPPDGLANRCFRPLSHLSVRCVWAVYRHGITLDCISRSLLAFSLSGARREREESGRPLFCGMNPGVYNTLGMEAPNTPSSTLAF